MSDMLEPKGTLTYAFAPSPSDRADQVKGSSSVVVHPASHPWRYVFRRRYIKDQLIEGLVFAIAFLILGWLAILWRFVGNLLGNPPILLGGVLAGTLVGIALGYQSWQRQVPRIEKATPRRLPQGLAWFAWLLFFWVVVPLLAQIFGAMLADPSSSPFSSFLLWQ